MPAGCRRSIKKMKKILIAFMLIALSMGFDSCISTRDSVNVNKVEIGMSKEQVQKLLGRPLFKNADEDVEEWGYKKIVGEILDSEEMIFIVSFNNEGKVIAYNSRKMHPHYR